MASFAGEPPTSVMVVEVLHNDGSPARDSWVELFPPPSGQPDAMKTSKVGTVRFQDIPAGTYMLKVHHPPILVHVRVQPGERFKKLLLQGPLPRPPLVWRDRKPNALPTGHTLEGVLRMLAPPPKASFLLDGEVLDDPVLGPGNLSGGTRAPSASSCSVAGLACLGKQGMLGVVAPPQTRIPHGIALIGLPAGGW